MRRTWFVSTATLAVLACTSEQPAPTEPTASPPAPSPSFATLPTSYVGLDLGTLGGDRAYAIANPGRWRGYGPNVWGLSACDGPIDGDFVIEGRKRHFFTYAARGASAREIRDDGTIAPTAAASSLPFAPEIVIPAILEMRSRAGGGAFT